MIQTITLDGGREIKLAANAATPLRYKQLFGQDLLRVFQQSTKTEEDGVLLADIVAQLAFIMNRQAEKQDLNAVSMDEFYSWLEDFGSMDFVLAGQDIMNVYLDSTKVSVDAKKK